MPKPTTVSQYIAAAAPQARPMLRAVRAAIKSTCPQAKEKISYGMPFYEYKHSGVKGRLVYIGAFTKHVSLFAWGKEVDQYPALKKYKTSTGTLQFPIGTRVPVRLVKKAVKARMHAIDEFTEA